MHVESSNTDKAIPHPVLDDTAKMMRIIANPVYDKLTISRAAQIRRLESMKYYNRNSVLINRTKNNRKSTPLKSLNSEQILKTPLTVKATSTHGKPNDVRQKSPSFHLPTLSSNNDPSLIHNNPTVNRSRSHSVLSSTARDDRKSVNDNSTIRYVNSQHGFEVQRYSSGNWLSVDILSKDACEAEERTFRQMVEQKEQDELISHSIYTSEYYLKRWRDLSKSFKQGNLTHMEWAEQSYKLNCFKKYYATTIKRERSLIELNEEKQRRRRAQTAFKEWKQTKTETHSDYRPSYLTEGDSFNTTDIASITSHPSLSINNNILNQTSTSTSTDTEPEDLSRSQINNNNNNRPDSSSGVQYMLDEQRWSLKAMLKRIVGLAEPLPPSPKIISYNNSSLTMSNYNSSFPSYA